MEIASNTSKPNPITINLAALSSDEYNELCQSYGTRYEMGNSGKKAYIFHHQTFDKFSNSRFPNSGIKDQNDITAVLQNLHFQVTVYKDLSMGELHKTLKEISSANHQNTDCIVIVMMTSGMQGYLYAKDDQYPVAMLWDGFVGNRYPTLVGKPKLFFIQTRMGTLRNQSPGRDAQGECANYVIPSMADVIVVSSCYYEDTVNSVSNTTQNTPVITLHSDDMKETAFIQSLCDELYAFGRDKEILDMLTAILRNTQRKHAIKQEKSDTGKSKSEDDKTQCIEQPIPTIVSTLTKKLYFYGSKDN